jgi:hypothetical protein
VLFLHFLVDFLNILIDIEFEDSFSIESAEFECTHIVFTPFTQVAFLLFPPIKLVFFVLKL